MQLHVITGSRKTGKTKRLRAVQAELKSQGINASIVTGNACTTPYLVDQIKRSAESGACHFLADDCTREQIKAVQRQEPNLSDDITVYLVRQA